MKNYYYIQINQFGGVLLFFPLFYGIHIRNRFIRSEHYKLIDWMISIKYPNQYGNAQNMEIIMRELMEISMREIIITSP